MTPSGIESATFRFVAQHLNHCATAGREGKLQVRWLESGEEDLKKMCVGNWSLKSQDREEWRAILEGAARKVQREL